MEVKIHYVIIDTYATSPLLLQIQLLELYLMLMKEQYSSNTVVLPSHTLDLVESDGLTAIADLTKSLAVSLAILSHVSIIIIYFIFGIVIHINEQCV